jgi:uncharacterized protein (TIGR02246 family)
MRHAILWFSLMIAACSGNASSSTRDTASTITEGQKRSVEDTVRKLIAASIAAQNRGDMKFVRAYYAASALSVQSGVMYPNVDSMFDNFPAAKPDSQPKLKTSAKVERIDVLSPDAAAVTTSSQTSADSAGKTITWGHISTLVLKNIDGRWRVLQEHASLVPESK